MFEIGTVCLKIAGREASRYCVIVEKIDDSFVMITGPKTVTGVKRRRCNIDHLEPTENKLDINAKASDEMIEEKWKNSGLIEKLEIKIPVKKTKTEKPKETGEPKKKSKKEAKNKSE